MCSQATMENFIFVEHFADRICQMFLKNRDMSSQINQLFDTYKCICNCATFGTEEKMPQHRLILANIVFQIYHKKKKSLKTIVEMIKHLSQELKLRPVHCGKIMDDPQILLKIDEGENLDILKGYIKCVLTKLGPTKLHTLLRRLSNITFDKTSNKEEKEQKEDVADVDISMEESQVFPVPEVERVNDSIDSTAEDGKAILSKYHQMSPISGKCLQQKCRRTSPRSSGFNKMTTRELRNGKSYVSDTHLIDKYRAPAVTEEKATSEKCSDENEAKSTIENPTQAENSLKSRDENSKKALTKSGDENSKKASTKATTTTTQRKSGEKRRLVDPEESGETLHWSDDDDVSDNSRDTGCRSSTQTGTSNRHLRPSHKKVKFSTDEERYLKEGVRRYGVGNWSIILNAYNFRVCRSNVSLKDKYRTMLNRGEI